MLSHAGFYIRKYTTINMPEKTRFYNKYFSFLLKLLIGFAAVYYLWQYHHIGALVSGFSADFSYKLMFILFFLSLLNWILEVYKWYFLVSHVQKISFFSAGYQSLVSFAFSMLTPNRIGEYGVKVLFFEPSRRKKIFSLSLIGNLSQLSATVFFGIAGIISGLYTGLFELRDWINIPYYTLGIFLFLLVILWWGYKQFVSHKQLVLNNLQIWKASFLLALLRYIIFSVQFYVLLRYFGVSTGALTLFTGIFLTYLLATFIPMLAFLDWAVKGSVAVWVFGQIGLSDSVILKITGLMWFFNFFIPFVLGIISYLWQKKAGLQTRL